MPIFSQANVSVDWMGCVNITLCERRTLSVLPVIYVACWRDGDKMDSSGSESSLLKRSQIEIEKG